MRIAAGDVGDNKRKFVLSTSSNVPQMRNLNRELDSCGVYTWGGRRVRVNAEKSGSKRGITMLKLYFPISAGS